MIIMISDILKTLIQELKIRNVNNKLKKNVIYIFILKILILKKIKFISDLILNNYKDDEYH